MLFLDNLDFIISYGEIALKSRYVRSQLERNLVQHISKNLEKFGYTSFSVKRKFGRIIVNNVPREAAKIVANTFGVVGVMPAMTVNSDFKNIVNELVKYASIYVSKQDSFALRPKVIGNHNFGSRDLAVVGGSKILESLGDRELTVNLDEPNITFYIEVRDENTYLYHEKIAGVKGLPYGSQGKMVSLFSGGIDSPVGTWLMMKRGIEIYPLFMDQSPYVGESYLSRVKDAYNVLQNFVPKDNFFLYSAPIGQIMSRLMESPEPKFTCIICKRSMYKIAEKFAEEKNAIGLVTGESLGQVASQTADNLLTLNYAVKMPVYRPLIGFDKVEIERISRKINSYSVTAKKVDGCKCVPNNPATKSNLSKIEVLEDLLDISELCNEAAENIKIMHIN